MRAVVFGPVMLKYANYYQLVCVAAASLLTLAFWPEASMAVLIGGVVMAANFWALRILMDKLMPSESQNDSPQPRKAVWLVLLMGKFLGVLVVMGMLVAVLDLHPMGLAVGMLALFAGVALGMVHFTITGAERTSNSTRA